MDTHETPEPGLCGVIQGFTHPHSPIPIGCEILYPLGTLLSKLGFPSWAKQSQGCQGGKKAMRFTTIKGKCRLVVNN